MINSKNIKRTIIPIVSVNTNHRLGCAWEKPWADKSQYVVIFDSLEKDAVLVLSYEQWLLTSNKPPVYKTVVVTKHITAMNALGLTPDICITPEKFWSIHKYHECVVGKQMYIVGPFDKIEEAYSKCKTIYHIESNNVNLKNGRVLGYKYELVNKLFNEKYNGTYLHTNSKYRFTVHVLTRKPLAAMLYKRASSWHRKYIAKKVLSQVLVKQLPDLK